MPEQAAIARRGKASAGFPLSASWIARRNASAGWMRPVSRSSIVISRLPHRFLTYRKHGAENVFEDGAAAHLHVRGDRHAGGYGEVGRHAMESDVVDGNLRAIEQIGIGGQHRR